MRTIRIHAPIHDEIIIGTPVRSGERHHSRKRTTFLRQHVRCHCKGASAPRKLPDIENQQGHFVCTLLLMPSLVTRVHSTLLFMPSLVTWVHSKAFPQRLKHWSLLLH